MTYEILELLGAGGMGQVYRARDPKLDREVALKLLRGDDPQLEERALREARHQARIDHEHVARVYDVGETDGKPFIAMQLIDGQPLDVVARGWSLETRVLVMRQVVEGVQAAHSQGLIHRDLKPGNILVEEHEDGWHPWVVDFGLALDPTQPGITATGAMVGTAAYMSPEQIRGERGQLDRRTDVYSLGATLFETLTGAQPFAGTAIEVAVRALRDEAPSIRTIDSTLPPELALITAKCLEKDPDHRYPSARLLAEDLDRFLRGEPILAQPPSRIYRFRKLIRRHRGLSIVLAIATLVSLGFVAVTVELRIRARAQSRWTQELGREAERIAATLRLAEMGPRRDLGPVKNQLRRRIETLEEDLRIKTPLAMGPARVAMAEAFLALGDLDRARQRLEQARAFGYQNPGLERVYGQTLGRLFLRRKAEIKRLSPRWQDLELQRERRELLEPALLALGQASLSPDESDLAFVSLLESRLEIAEQHATTALDEDPFDHRRLLLLARIQTENAQRAFASEEQETALVHLRRALETLKRAEDIARSDPEVFRAQCDLAELRLEVELVGSLAVGDELADFIRPCNLAVETDSLDAANLGRRAGLRRHLAARSMRRGEDPLDDLNAAIADGKAALDLDPDHFTSLHATGVAYLLRANHAAGEATEVEADLEAASNLLQRCVERAPAFIPCRISLGVNWLETGISRDNSRSVDADETVEAFLTSIREQEQAIELAPEVAVLRNNIAYTQVYLAEVQLKSGVDPRPRLDAARRQLVRARELAPDYASAPFSVGESHRVEALFQWAQSRDPSPSIEAAITAYREALRLDPQRYYAAERLMVVYELEARARLEQGHGESGDEALAEAMAALEHAETLSGEPLACERSDLLLLSARARMRASSDTESKVRTIWREISRLTPGQTCPRQAAALVLQRCLFQVERGSISPSLAASIAEALRWLDDFLDENPGDWRALGLAADLHWLAASQASEPEARLEQERRANARRREALTEFAVISPRWEPLLTVSSPHS